MKGVAQVSIGLDGVKGALAACQGALGTAHQSEHMQPQSRRAACLPVMEERSTAYSNGQRRRIVICILANILYLLEKSKCHVDEVVKNGPALPWVRSIPPAEPLEAGQHHGVLDGVYRMCEFRRW